MNVVSSHVTSNLVTSYACSVQDLHNLVASNVTRVQYRSTNHDAFLCEVTFSFGLCCFALVPSIFFSVIFSTIASIKTDSKFHTKIKQPVKLHFCVFELFVIR